MAYRVITRPPNVAQLSRLPLTLYQIIQPSQYNEAVSFYYEHFLPHNPVYSCLGLYQRHPYLDQYVLKILKANRSWCAVESTSGEMIGLHLCASINADNLPPNRTLEDYISQGLPENLAHVQILRNKLFNPKEMLKDYHVEKIMYFNGSAVHSDHCKEGIITALAGLSIEHGMKCGYRLIAANCESFYAQKICEKIGFEKKKELMYADYAVNGKVVYGNMKEPHRSIVNFVKQLF